MQNFECFLCREILKTPFECPNCNNNFCKVHIPKLQQCPKCNKKNQPYEYIQNFSLENIINNYEFSCKNGCGFKCFGPFALENHLNQCIYNNQIKCVLCPFKGNEEAFWNHLVENHKKQIINQFGSITKSENKISKNIFDNGATSSIFGTEISNGTLFEKPSCLYDYMDSKNNTQLINTNYDNSSSADFVNQASTQNNSQNKEINKNINNFVNNNQILLTDYQNLPKIYNNNGGIYNNVNTNIAINNQNNFHNLNSPFKINNLNNLNNINYQNNINNQNKINGLNNINGLNIQNNINNKVITPPNNYQIKNPNVYNIRPINLQNNQIINPNMNNFINNQAMSPNKIPFNPQNNQNINPNITKNINLNINQNSNQNYTLMPRKGSQFPLKFFKVPQLNNKCLTPDRRVATPARRINPVNIVNNNNVQSLTTIIPQTHIVNNNNVVSRFQVNQGVHKTVQRYDPNNKNQVLTGNQINYQNNPRFVRNVKIFDE